MFLDFLTLGNNSILLHKSNFQTAATEIKVALQQKREIVHSHHPWVIWTIYRMLFSCYFNPYSMKPSNILPFLWRNGEL